MTSPFNRTTMLVVVAVIAVSITAAVALTVFKGEPVETETAGAHGYSTSAIGHRGLAALLMKLGVPVIASRSDSASKARNGLLVIAEPSLTDDAAVARFSTMLAANVPTLVVLPKWYGQTERGKRWIEDASFIPADEIAPIFPAMSIDAELRRQSMPTLLEGAGPGSTPNPNPPNAGAPARPFIREPQLIISDDIEAFVSTPDGAILFGKVHETVWVLSDPDVLNNFGLRNADNARFTAWLIDELRGVGPVVFDETLHGYAQQPSLLRTLFSFPLVLATMQVLLCALLAVWAAMVRFGPLKASSPPIAPGKDFLVRNTAALLQYGGHHSHALRRYLQHTVAAVKHALHAPALAPSATREWLERVRLVRGGTLSLTDLERAVEQAKTPERIVEVADQVFRWRVEMTHGTDSRS